MYEFWYFYVKTNYGEKVKLCDMDTDSCIVCIKTDDIYKDTAEDIGAIFDTSNYELDKQLIKGKNKNIIKLVKDELGKKIMIQFLRLRVKTYSYLIHDGNEDKKAKSTRKCSIKRKVKFENYRNCYSNFRKL